MFAAPSMEGCGLSRTTLLMAFNGADKTEALIHFKGASGGGHVRDLSIGTADTGVRGGSLIRLEAKANNAPDATALENLYMTSYSGNVSGNNASTKVPTAGTNANPGVFSLTAHGYSVDDIVVLLVTTRNSGWRDLNFQAWKINTVPTADTFTLKTLGGTPLDTTSWSTFPTGGITIKKALCADVCLSIDGTARTTGAVGVRNTKLNHLQIFGGAVAAIEALGAIELSAPGVTTSHAGWNAQVYLGGISGVETYYAQFDGGTIAALNEDRAIYTHGSVTIQSWHKRTTNTVYSDVKGWRGGDLIDPSAAGNLNADASLIHHGGGIVTQIFAVTGVTSSYAAFNYPVAFTDTPTSVVLTPTNSSSAVATMVPNAIGKTSVEICGDNLHASGTGICAVTGQI
jgi:hypothetical protein